MSNVTGKQRLIVGIDYGTTYSGLSFALTGATDFRDINTWTKYPGASSHSAEHYEKAPTRIAFKWENDGMEGDAWGYQVEPGMKTYTWTKLLLDQLAVQSEFDDPDLYLANGENIMKLPEGKCASWVVTEYLKKLKAMFDDAVPLHSVAQTINDLPMDFWITVPASWTEKARLLTIKAAKDAGFGTRDIDTVSLISEPEAAAHAVLKSSLHRLEEFVEV
jgi:molecular chaperone DnaK (HSP70)